MSENQTTHSEEASGGVTDTTYDDKQYYRLYWWLGKYYPESDLVYRIPAALHRFKVVLKELRPLAEKGKKLLDAGCGSGLYTVEYCRMGGKAHGIDISEDLVKKARARARHHQVEASFSVLDLQKKIDWNERYDAVLFTEVLEHLNHPRTGLRNLANALDKNGHMIVTMPTPLHHSRKLRWAYVKEVMEGKKLFELHKYQTMGWAPSEYGAPDFYFRHSGFYPKGSKNWIESFGFKCLYYYTISFFMPGIRKAARIIPISVLRKLHPLSLLGSYNVQVFLRTG